LRTGAGAGSRARACITWKEVDIEGHEAGASTQFRFDPSLIAAWQRDIDAACAAGDRLVARADPDAVPLSVVRLPVSVEGDERK